MERRAADDKRLAPFANGRGRGCRSGPPLPLEQGDHVEIALADLLWNSPLPWDRARGASNGTLAWDFGMVSRRVTASFGGTGGRVDALFFRADIVARGGDVDARAQA